MQQQKVGFTFIELSVVVAILGVLTNIAIPNIGQLISSGKTGSYESELHHAQTAVTAMLVDSTSGNLILVDTPTADMDTVQTTDTPALTLSDYLIGLNPDGTVKSGCTYTFTSNGTVTQILP